MKVFLISLMAVFLIAGGAHGYGNSGHSLVGAVADQRLAQDQQASDRVHQLLDGSTLERAATIPDELKSFDACRGGKPRKSPLPLANVSARIKAELLVFLNANQCNGNPFHRDFHFTDVPVAGNEKYADGTVGRSDFDIVHMIRLCVRVLKGEEPETNERGITRSVAVILLAHYLGDIHQPLHVGAEYFDSQGEPFEPTEQNRGFADQGGNKLSLFTFIKGQETPAGNLHHYWDEQTVINAFGPVGARTVARLVKNEPADWDLTGDVETWAEQMADEILPIAREAHERLDFKRIQEKTGEKDILSGNAEERRQSGGTFYALWAAATVKEEIHKAGWRLAALLEKALQ